jgi:hypothetical protein
VVQKPEYRKIFLKLSRNLAPTGKTFSSIEFRTATGDTQIALTPESRSTINQALKQGRDPATSDSSGPEEEIIGVLRAVDLEKDFLNVIVNGQALHVIGLEDAMDDVIGPMVNKPVKVRVVRSTKGIRFRDIEFDE